MSRTRLKNFVPKLKGNDVGIYIITCLLTKQQYVGATSKLHFRWIAHCGLAKSGGGSLLHEAIRKYGRDQFIYMVLCRCPKKELEKKEKHFRKAYQTNYPKGYNIGNFTGHVTKDFLDTLSMEDQDKIGAYLRHRREKKKRAEDPEFDQEVHKWRSNAAVLGHRHG